MRIHRLDIQAFGPFAGQESVDFDALGAQGLFLLNGSTGAGKTSVLDAVAYALYGQLPGARKSSLKRLRSDHAAEGTGPEVVCEFSAGGRRLEVRRSPEWMRPAKRGTGITKEQASTQLREKIDGAWVALSQRNDEAASEIQRLLGMSMEQFTKVILLAQGEFAAFLRASAKDREELLEKLFGTEVYQDLELRLGTDAKEAAAQLGTGMAQLTAHEQLARSQAAAVLEGAGLVDGDVPGGEDVAAQEDDAAAAQGADAAGAGTVAAAAAPVEVPDQPGLHSNGAELFAWLAESVAQAVHRAATDLADTERRAALGAEAVAAAEQRASRHAIRDAALAEQERLKLLAADAEQWQQTLRRHHGAQVLAAVVDAADQTAAEQSGAELAVARARDAFAGDALATRVGAAQANDATASETATHSLLVLAEPELPLLELVEKELAAQVAAVTAAMPGEQRVAQARTQLVAEEEKLAAATAEVAAQRLAETTGRERLLAATSEVAALREDAVPVQQARERHTGATELVTSIMAHTAQKAATEELTRAELAARELAVRARANWLDAVERRLSLAAGELAATLVDGEPCQVCGSTAHPAPSEQAGSGADAVQVEKKAKTASEAAEKQAADAQGVLAQARQKLAVLAERGGDGELAQARAAVVLAKEQRDTAVAAAARLVALAAAVEVAEAAVSAAQTALLAATGVVASLTAGNAGLVREIEGLEAGLAVARAGFASLAQRKAAIASAQQATGALMAALRREESTALASVAAAQALLEALGRSSFEDVGQVRAALAAQPIVEKLQHQVAAFERSGTLNTAQLERAEVAEAALEAGAGLGAPGATELAQLGEDALQLRTEAAAAAVDLGLARKAAAQLRATHAAFAQCEEQVVPLRERSALLAGLAEAVRGGGENQLKMTLTSYVLAARLEQVASAASSRLSTMSGGRYTLSHTDAKAGGNRKSGLGLEVVDEWTQRSRDTSTLSGGESFMASLALALGLADVVQQESGGLDIETLFVDEGFGSLDEESLDQVMDALEGLRDGGRVVGLVSHVAEMKTRIPVHLQVTKGRNGSTLSIGEL
ncbi:AAA family ATPase [Arthrobacter sp. AQ5-05]|uniref:AAA family ATPase n=1 Tax=Arthrobacter sp. AQ5-05 TaxID=2184581 RepID=UPI0012B6232D|nr:SMC family ATPase [Arthrobacter sp. AQ5-05]